MTSSEEMPSESNAKEDESVLKDTKTVDEEGEALQNATTGQKQAYKKALSYLRFTSFSYPGLIEQLEFDGFSTEDATFAVDNCGADWNEQAVNKGKSYLSFTSFSKDGLIEQLEHDGFTSVDRVKYLAKSPCPRDIETSPSMRQLFLFTFNIFLSSYDTNRAALPVIIFLYCTVWLIGLIIKTRQTGVII